MKLNIRYLLLLNFYFMFFYVGSLYATLPELKVSSIFDRSSYSPNDTVIVALKCEIPKKFHLYGNPLGPGIGKPLLIKTTNNNGIKWLGAKKMAPSKFQPDMGEWVWAYEKEAVFFIIGKVNDKDKKIINDTLVIDALICENSCIPVNSTIPISIKISKNSTNEISFSNQKKLQNQFLESEEMAFEQLESSKNESFDMDENLLIQFPSTNKNDENKKEIELPEWDYESVEKKFELSILLALLFAFLAGMILNVMPCVLPVIGIKIISFSKGAGDSKRNAIIRSIVFSAGMILVFLILASFAAFAGLSWGEQFQKPKMLIAIICIIFVFALGMFDVFLILIPTSISNLEQKSTKGFSILDDFIKGMFTTILATPCSGPLLGATLAWTLTKPPIVIYLIFFTIGLGMAFPYMLLSSSSRLMKLIPKPGRWMEDFKHFMGFLLFGFAVYLMIGLPKDMIVPTIGLCTVLAFTVVLYTRFAPFGSSLLKKFTVGLITIIIIFGGIYFNFTLLYNFISEEAVVRSEKKSITWEKFSPEKLINAHATGQHVIIDFTANWCMNCQFNKIRVYYSKEVNDLIRRKKILPLKADITNSNPKAESLMHNLGSRSVPFFAIFPGDDPYSPLIFRDIVSKKNIIKALSDLIEQ